MLQVFRRLSLIGYIAVLALAYIVFVIAIYAHRRSTPPNIIKFFLFYYLALPIFSLFTHTSEEFVTAIIRYGALMPFYYLALTHSDYIYENIENMLKTYTLVIFASAILMFYQVVFGRISFFVEVAGRLDYERYGSLLGSTTTYGTAALIAIFVLHDYELFSRKWKIIIEVSIIVGGILCLSKSFFINVVLAYGLIFVFKDRNGISIDMRKAFRNMIYLLIGLFILIILYKYTFVGEYFDGMLKYTTSGGTLGTEADLLERLTTRPINTFKYYNLPLLYYLLYGVGFKGYSGVLGLTQYPMCHNNYAELILTQGAPFLILIITFYISAFITAKKEKNNHSSFVNQCIPYMAINMIAGQWSYITVCESVITIIIMTVYVKGKCR